MKFSIKKMVFDRFPDLNVGVIVATNIHNKGEDEEIKKLLEEVEELIKDEYDLSTLDKHELINPWRHAYKRFGSTPEKFHSSVERLMREVLVSGRLKTLNKIMDIINYISLKYIVPIGIDDLDEVIGDVEIAVSDGTETFIPIGDEKKNKPNKGEIIYKDDIEVLSRRWNWKGCYKTRITFATHRAIIYIDGIPPLGKTDIENISKELGDMIKTSCDAEIQQFVLNKETPEIEFDAKSKPLNVSAV